MAQENIPLVITLGGVDKAVTSVRQFAQAIKEAQNRLLLIGDEGSVEFQQLDKDIQKARNQLQEFREDANQTKVQRGLKDFIEVGSSITAVFVGAQAALQAFGVESEAAGKASATVQNLLTLAITAQTVAQNKNALAKVANTVVTIGQTAATQGLIAATRLLWTTMLANPITAIVVLIGALASAYLLLKDDTDEAAEAQERYKNALDDTTSSNERQLALLQAQGKDEISIQKARIQAAKELAKIQEAEFVRLNTINRFSKETAAQRKLVIEAQAKVEVEQATLLRMEEAKTEKERQKNEENRKKREDAANQRILDSIRLRGELRKIELDAITSGPGIESFGFKETDVEKQEQVLKKLSTTQSDYNDVVEKYNQLTRELPREGQGFQFVDIPQNVSNQIKLLANLITQSFTLANLPANETTVRLRDLLKTQEGFLEGTYNNTQGYIENQQDLLKFERDFISQFVSEQIKGFTGNAEQTKLQREILAQQANVVFDNLIQNGKELNKVTTFIEGYTKRIDEVSKSNAKLAKSTEVVNGFIRENTELLVNSFDLPIKSIEETKVKIGELQNDIATQRFDDTKKFADDILQLEKILKDEGIDITKASYEEKLKLLKLFLEKEVNAVQDAENRKKKKQQDTISAITESIQAFQSVLNSLAQTTSQYYAFQLDLLAKNSEEIQKKIVGDSEEAVQLRLEQEQIYNEKKKQLEKQSAVTALRISLAQSIANVAESITRAFTAGPVIGQIAAGIIAGIGVAQTALIGAQLSQIQSLQRGGIIKGQGGLVVGPSHEYGGVKFQGGGIELEGGEAVINRQSAVRYGSLLSSVNQLGGGRPLVSNNFDDSRIVEAISKQRSEPIRAYVVEQDITSKQGVTRRLEQLSQI